MYTQPSVRLRCARDDLENFKKSNLLFKRRRVIIIRTTRARGVVRLPQHRYRRVHVYKTYYNNTHYFARDYLCVTSSRATTTIVGYDGSCTRQRVYTPHTLAARYAGGPRRVLVREIRA